MSGWDGFREKWRRHVTRVAGVALRDNMLHVVGLEWRDEAWEASFFCHVMLQAPEEELVQDLAEKTACLLAQKGWEQERVVFALPEGMATVFEESFPPGTEPKELQEMARYEVEARGLFSGSTFRAACAPAGDGLQIVAAVAESQLASIYEAFLSADLELWGVAVPPENFSLLCEGDALSWGEEKLKIAPQLLGEDGTFHGWDEGASAAIYGAALMVQAIHQPGLVFPFGAVQLSGWACGRIALAACAVVFVVLATLTSWDAYAYFTAQKDVRQARSDLAMLYGDTQHMEEEREEKSWVEQHDAALRKLTEEAGPAPAVLAHLGRLPVDGICLEKLDFSAGKPLILEGEAVTFDALAEYLQGFSRDTAFFPNGPQLRDSSRSSKSGDGETIHFSLELDVMGKEAP